MIAYQRIVDGHLEVFFLPALHRQSLFGVFREASKRPGPMDGEELEQAVMAAIAEEHERDEPEHG